MVNPVKYLGISTMLESLINGLHISKRIFKRIMNDCKLSDLAASFCFFLSLLYPLYAFIIHCAPVYCDLYEAAVGKMASVAINSNL